MAGRTVAKIWSMRKLGMRDIYPMSKILKKLGLKLNSLNDDGTKKSQTQLGAEMILSVAENIHLVQNEVNELLGSLVGITGEEMNELDLEDGLTIIALFKNQKGVANFLKSAGALTR